MEERKRSSGALVVLSLLALLVLFALVLVPPTAWAQARQRFKWVLTDKLTVRSGTSYFGGAATFVDDVSVAGTTSLGAVTASTVAASGLADLNAGLDVTGTLTLRGEEVYFGSEVVTSTGTATLGLTTVSGCVATLKESDLLDGEEQLVGCEDDSGDLSLKVLKEDGTAGDSGVTVYYWAWGQ